MPVPVTLTINFVSYFPGQHRVCWSTDGVVFDCTTLVTCLGFGSACSTVINTTVDNETCTDVTFTVYVQPICEPEVSLDKRAYSTYTFSPSPACKKYTLTCENVAVESINVTNPGTGYTIVPNVTLLGGGGIGATATATLDGMGGITIALTTPGSGYTSAPAVNIDPPDTPGVQAVAVAILDQCGSFAFPTCSGTYTVPADVLNVGDSVDVCSITAGGPVITSEYSKVENGNCLCDCTYATISVTGGNIDYYANNCNGTQLTGTLLSGASVGACIATGSLVWSTAAGSPVVTVTYASCLSLS